MNILQACQEYLDYLAEKNKSQATSATYFYALNRFVNFLQEECHIIPEKDLSSITMDELRRFGLYLYRKKLAPSSRITYLVVLRNWFKYLSRRGISTLNYDQIELPKLSRKVPHPDERLPIMLSIQQEAADPWRELIRRRDEAILEILFSTQVRVSELVALNRNSIDWEQGLAVITGKGGKTRTVFFSERAFSTINTYLDARKDRFLPLLIHHDRAHKPYGRDKEGEAMRLTRQSVERIVRKYARLAGVEVTPHTFRHYGATELLKAGADIRTVQEILGHSSVSTTQIYTHVSPRRLQQEWRKYHPASRETVNEPRLPPGQESPTPG